MSPASSRVPTKLLLVLVSTLLAIAVAEGLARLVGVRPEWGNLLPLHDAPTRTVDGVTLWSTESPRYDEADVRRAASDRDAFKIIGLGDSIMYGVLMPREDTYLEQARRLLQPRSKKKVEILNLAVPGYNTRQEDVVYKEIEERIRPDLVLVHFWTNDVHQYRVVGGYVVDFGDVSEDGRLVIRALPLPARLSDFLLLRSRLYAMLTHAAVVQQRKHLTEKDDFSNVLDPLSRIHERARRSGARLVVLASPDLSRAFPEPTTDVPLLREFAASRGIDVIALSDWLNGIRSERISLSDGCHFNTEGHRIIAEHLAEYLLARDLKESRS